MLVTPFTDPCVGGGMIGRLCGLVGPSTDLVSVEGRFEGYARKSAPPPTPVSLQARLEGYARKSAPPHPPTLCRWRHDWKAMHVHGDRISPLCR